MLLCATALSVLYLKDNYYMSTEIQSETTTIKTESSSKRLSKAEILTKLAVEADLTRKQIADVLDALEELISSEIVAGREFVIPNLIKIVVSEKAATQETRRYSPLTKQVMTYKAKPARKTVKARVLSGLKKKLA